MPFTAPKQDAFSFESGPSVAPTTAWKAPESERHSFDEPKWRAPEPGQEPSELDLLEQRFQAGEELTPEESVKLAQKRSESRTLGQAALGVFPALGHLAMQGIGTAKEVAPLIPGVFGNVTGVISPQDSAKAYGTLAKIGAEGGLQGAAGLGEIGRSAWRGYVSEPAEILGKAVQQRGVVGTLSALAPLAVTGALKPLETVFRNPAAELSRALPEESKDVLKRSLEQTREEQQAAAKRASLEEPLVKDVATAGASLLGASTETAQKVGEAVAAPPEYSNAVQTASLLMDPQILMGGPIRSIISKALPRLAEAGVEAGRLAKIRQAAVARDALVKEGQLAKANAQWTKDVSTTLGGDPEWQKVVQGVAPEGAVPPQMPAPLPRIQAEPGAVPPKMPPPVPGSPESVQQAQQRFAAAAEEAAQPAVPGTAQRAAQTGAEAVDVAGKRLGAASEWLGGMAEKYERPLAIGSALWNLAHGSLSGAALGALIPKFVEKSAKTVAQIKTVGAALKSAVYADWSAQMPVWRQVAKNMENAPAWLVKGVTLPAIGEMTVGEVVERGVRAGARGATGAAHGAAFGAAMGLAQPQQTGEELGGAVGAGMGLGLGMRAAHGIVDLPSVGAMTPQDRAVAFAADAMRQAAKDIREGSDPLAVALTTDKTMATATLLPQLFRGIQVGGKDLTVSLRDNARFEREATAGNQKAAAYYDSTEHQIVVNVEKYDPEGRLLHEAAHPLFESVLVSKPEMLRTFQETFSPELLQAAREMYAKNTGLDPAKLSDQYVVAELFSDMLADQLRGLDLGVSLRKQKAGAAVNQFVERGADGSLTDRSRAIQAAMADPVLVDVVREQFEALRDFRPLVDSLKERGVRLRPDQAGKHPALERGSDFVEELSDGRVVAASPEKVRKKVATRRQEVKALYPDTDPVPAGQGGTDIAVRELPSGGKAKTGTTLGDKFYTSATTFGNGLKLLAKRLEQAIATGGTVSGWYQEIGERAKEWTGSVQEHLGNIEAKYKDFIPYAFEVTKQGNILAKVVSLTGLDRKAQVWANNKSGVFNLDAWGGSVDAFKADVKTYLKNHAENRPGSDGIGETKKNLINAFLVGNNKTFEAFNPLRALMGPKEREGTISSYRLDRLQTVEPSEVTGYTAADYGKWLRNLSGEARSAVTTENKYATEAQQIQEGVREERQNRNPLWETPEAGGRNRLFGPEGGQGPLTEGPLRRFSGEAKPLGGEPGFYSKLERVVESEMKGESMPAAQLKAILRNRGVKTEELKWTRVDDKIDSLATKNGGKVPKQELLRVLKETRPQFRLEDSSSEKTQYVVFDDTGHSIVFDDLEKAESAQQNWADELAQQILNDAQYRVEETGEGTFKIVTNAGDDPRIRDFSGNLLLPPYEEYASESDAESALREAIQEQSNSLINLKEKRSNYEPDFELWTLPGGKNYREIAFADPNIEKWKGGSRHNFEALGSWDAVGNIQRIAHMRINDRTDSNGRKGLFIEEIQSDRHQTGRSKGYKEESPQLFQYPDGDWGMKGWELKFGTKESALEHWRHFPEFNPGTPDAPFRKDWALQMFKRALKDAVDGGKTWIGWTDGETQAERFRLSKHVKSLEYHPETQQLYAYGYSGDDIFGGNGREGKKVAPEDLVEMIGKEAAEQLLAQPLDPTDKVHRLETSSLKLGGEGMKKFYDSILPLEVEKYVKKWGAKVEQTDLPFSDKTGEEGGEGVARIWKVDISPEMAHSISSEGQERFSGEAKPIQTDTPEFKRWFAGSKIVDESGKPLMLFHGTGVDFTEFRPGTYLATSFKYAAQHGDRVLPVYLSAKRIAELMDEDFRALAWHPEKMERYIKSGYDAISTEEGNAYIVLKPNKVKSAIGNRGTFDPSNPDIRFSGETKPLGEEIPPAERNLVALHNTSEGGLREILRLGGVPAPSLAVTRKDIPFQSFGEITLVGRRPMVDPQADPRNRLFAADVYSARQPRAEFTAKPEEIKNVVQKINALLPKDGKLTWSERVTISEGLKQQGPNNRRTVENSLLNNLNVKRAFLEKEGVNIPVERSVKVYNNQLTADELRASPDIFEAVNALPKIPKINPYDALTTPEGIRLADAVRKAVEKKYAEMPDLAARLVESSGGYGRALSFVAFYKIVGDVERLQRGEATVDTEKLTNRIEKAFTDKTKKTDFVDWVRGLTDRIFEEAPVLRSGRRKMPYTLENVTSKMTSQKVRGAEEGTFGLGRARAMVAPEIMSISEAHNRKYLISPEAELNKVKLEQEKLFFPVATELGKRARVSEGSWETLDNLGLLVSKVMKNPKGVARLTRAAGYVDVPPSVLADIVKLAQITVDAPTEYFEAKPQRPVALSEFAGAVVPRNVSPAIVKALEKAGLKVETYNTADDRPVAVQKIVEESQVSFSGEAKPAKLEPQPEYIDRILCGRVRAQKLVPESPNTFVNITIPKEKGGLSQDVLESQNRQKFYESLDAALKTVQEDPARLANNAGYAEYMKRAGVSGEVMAAPPLLKTLLEKPQDYVDLVTGGYHGDKTKPGTLEAAMNGLDSTVQMRKAILTADPSGTPPALVTAMHHLWGILSRMLPPVHQEAAWLRLVSQPEVLAEIQNSIDGTYTRTPKQWNDIVSRAFAETRQSDNKLGNNAKSNANSFQLMLERWNGKWNDASAIYSRSSSIPMGRAFWSMGKGPVGIANKVQRFIGLTFGIPGLIMDRWKFVELYMPQFGIEPRAFFDYSSSGTPEDPAGLYAAYGTLERKNSAMSLAFYEGLETALQRSIQESAELRKLLGNHPNVGGLHWVGWNAIKNEAVGHSSLDLTKDLIQRNPNPTGKDVLELLSKKEYYTEGLDGHTLKRFSLKKP